MDLICKITDKDIGKKPIEMKNPRLRLGARGIVIREDGKIAIFNKSNKNEYKLPGGGLEGEEKPEEAFCLEKEEPIFKAREKNHSIVKDVAKKMETLKVSNLILWHTIDNDIKNRKKLYIEEAKKFFSGNVYVPNDLEEIIL